MESPQRKHKDGQVETKKERERKGWEETPRGTEGDKQQPREERREGGVGCCTTTFRRDPPFWSEYFEHNVTCGTGRPLSLAAHQARPQSLASSSEWRRPKQSFDWLPERPA